MRLFDRRTAAVLRAYETSWLNLVVLVIYIVVVFFAALIVFQETNLHSSIDFISTWNMTFWARAHTDPSRVTSLQLTSYGSMGPVSELDQALRPESLLQVPGGLPRLKHLTINGALSEKQLVLLFEHRQLESLSVAELEPISPAGWSVLARQPLKFLDIRQHKEPFWDVAKFPASLETLVIRQEEFQERPLDQSSLKPLRGLLSLRTLALNLRPDNRQLKAADQEVLSNLPSLRWLYVISWHQFYLPQLQADLPHLAIRPGNHESSRILKCQVLMCIMLAPLSLILRVMSLQFLTPTSMLTPHFSRFHLRTAGGLWLALVLVQSLGLIGAHCSVLSAVSLSASACLLFYVITWMLSRQQPFPGYANIILMFPLVIFTAMTFMSVPNLSPAECDWFLAGHRPGLAVALLLVSIGAVVGLARFFVGLPRSQADRVRVEIPMKALSDLWTFQRWQLEASSSDTNKKNWAESIHSSGQAQRLARALACPRTSPHFQSLLWRASQIFTAQGFTLVFVGMMSLMCLAMYWFQLNNPAGIEFTIGPFVPQFLGAALMAPYVVLQAQRPFLARHLLMSLSRREWVQLIFRETARDFLPAIAMTTVGVCVLPYMTTQELWPIGHIAALCVAGLLLVYAAELISATYPNWLLFVGILVSLVLFVLVATFGYMRLVDHHHSFEQAFGFFSRPYVCWGLALILAVSAIRFAYHRWMTFELDTILR